MVFDAKAKLLFLLLFIEAWPIFFLMMFYVHTMFVFSVCVVVIVVPVFIALVNAAVVVVNQSVADL